MATQLTADLRTTHDEASFEQPTLAITSLHGPAWCGGSPHGSYRAWFGCLLGLFIILSSGRGGRQGGGLGRRAGVGGVVVGLEPNPPYYSRTRFLEVLGVRGRGFGGGGGLGRAGTPNPHIT